MKIYVGNPIEVNFLISPCFSFSSDVSFFPVDVYDEIVWNTESNVESTKETTHFVPYHFKWSFHSALLFKVLIAKCSRLKQQNWKLNKILPAVSSLHFISVYSVWIDTQYWRITLVYESLVSFLDKHFQIQPQFPLHVKYFLRDENCLRLRF